MSSERVAEMTGHGQRWKTKSRFPIAAHRPWKSLRDSHIPATPAAAAMGKWKSKTRIPTFPQLSNPSFKTQNRKESSPA
jgi:hypothetical protein